MSTSPGGFLHFATANDTGNAGIHAELVSATVNTGAASAVLTIYNAQAVDANNIVAIINAAATGSYYFGGLRLGKGLFAKLTGGNADCTVGYR